MSRRKQKFKVGQKVRIVDDEQIPRQNLAMDWNDYMEDDFGKIVTITELDLDIGRNLPYVRTKESSWSWDLRLVKPVNEEVTSRTHGGWEFVHEDYILPCGYSLKKVIENDRAVICFVEEEGTGKIIKTVAICQEGDSFDLETGVEICMYKTLRKIADSKLKKY